MTMTKEQIGNINVKEIGHLMGYYYLLNPNGHWFDNKTMMFFNTKILHTHIKTVNRVVYFIAGNKFDSDTPRTYKMQELNLVSGTMDSASPTEGETLDEAEARYNAIGTVTK